MAAATKVNTSTGKNFGLGYKSEVPKEADVQTASQLPKPTGWRMLLALPELKEETEGGILIPTSRLADERAAAVIGYVLKQGPQCYKDPKRFEEGKPWCKEGDWVIIGSYTGTRLLIHGKEFRIINDDNIEAVVEDPRGISRVGG
jgi:chaperonin GroES